MDLRLITGMIGICSPLTTSKNENQEGDAQPRAQNEHVLVAGGVNSFPYFMYFETPFDLGIFMNLVHSDLVDAEPGDFNFNWNVSPKEKHDHNGLTDRCDLVGTDRAICYDYPYVALVDIDHSTCAVTL